MKKAISILLVISMLSVLCVSSCALEKNNVSDTSSQVETVVIDGKIFKISRSSSRNSGLTITVSGENESSILTRQGNKITIKEEVNGVTREFSFDVPDTDTDSVLSSSDIHEDDQNGLSRITNSYATEYWNFYCKSNTSRVNTAGILWQIKTPELTEHAAYDGNNAVYRADARAFENDLYEINAQISECNNIMIQWGESAFVNAVATHIAFASIGAIGGIPGVAAALTISTITGILTELGATARSASYWKSASDLADRARRDFYVFRSETESQIESFPLATAF